MHIFKNPNFNFLRWRWPAMGVSAALIVAGVSFMATEQQVRDAVQGEEVVQR